MITDDLLRLSTAQAVTASAVSENTIDLGVTRDIGEGKPLYMHFNIDANFATATSVNFEIITSAAAALTSPTVISSSGTIVIALLIIGKSIVVPIPPQLASLGQRYLGARYVITGSSASAGKVTTDIVETVQDGEKFHASGFVV